MTPFFHSRNAVFELEPGDEITVGDAPYSVEKIAKGGMGLVLLLHQDLDYVPRWHSVHGLKIAVKTLLPEYCDAEAYNLFHRELSVWAGFRHPNIVTLNEILDAGADGWVAAMNWCLGSLRDYLKKKRRLDLKESTDILGDIIDGLNYAYTSDRVLHLDLKPENVLYHVNVGSQRIKRESDQWEFMISDWGISSVKNPQLSKIVDLPLDHSDSLHTFNNMGTVLYMAPERFTHGYSSSLSSDLFSLGMIYLEMLTGTLPFTFCRHPVEELLSKKYLESAVRVMQQASIPRPIRQIILTCIAYNPNDRPKNYASLRKDLIVSYLKSTTPIIKLFT